MRTQKFYKIPLIFIKESVRTHGGKFEAYTTTVRNGYAIDYGKTVDILGPTLKKLFNKRKSGKYFDFASVGKVLLSEEQFVELRTQMEKIADKTPEKSAYDRMCEEISYFPMKCKMYPNANAAFIALFKVSEMTREESNEAMEAVEYARTQVK